MRPAVTPPSNGPRFGRRGSGSGARRAVRLGAGLALLLAACPQAPREPESTGAAARTEPVRTPPTDAARTGLAGWWLRHDQGYMIVIEAVGEDGTVEARYLNPAPVHVSRAEMWTEDGAVRFRLELDDRNYPGNYYDLVHDAARDMWVGLYHHLGNGETYEVYFLRFDDAEAAGP